MLGGAASNKTSSYTLVAADAGTAISMTSTSATTITVNDALFAAGDTVQITNLGSGVSTITAGTATVNTSASLALAQYESGTLDFTSASAAIFIKGAGAVASSGLTLITAQSFTTAAAVNVNNVFSATYENYKVIIDWRASSGNASLSCRFRTSGTDNSTSSYYLVRSGADAAGNTENQCHGAAAQLNYLAYGNDTTLSTISIDVMKPFAAKKTTVNGTSCGLTTGFSNVAGHALNCLFDAATSFDGFSIYPSASTVNGVVRIYGYAN
jgi:hypothetical protein